MKRRDGVKATGVWLAVSALIAWSGLTGCAGANVGGSAQNTSGGSDTTGAAGGRNGVDDAAGRGVSGSTSAQGASGGNAETPSTGGTDGTIGGDGGQIDSGGQPNEGGTPDGAGGTSGMSGGGAGVAGTSGCISGAPCTCGASPGTTQCADAASSCVCPTLPECQSPTDPSCFQPCGGDPFGAWVLESACYAAAPLTQGNCTSFTRATAGNNDLRMRLLDGGTLDLAGTEVWSTTTEMSSSCVGLPSNSECSSATFKAAVLLFSDVSYANCAANSCAGCECKNSDLFATSHLSGSDFGSDAAWSRNGNNLNLELGFGIGTVVTPYCVQADELWVGGTNPTDGTPKVSYKFKKQSCTGTPTPCDSRTSAECEAGGDCTAGEDNPRANDGCAGGPVRDYGFDECERDGERRGGRQGGCGGFDRERPGGVCECNGGRLANGYSSGDGQDQDDGFADLSV